MSDPVPGQLVAWRTIVTELVKTHAVIIPAMRGLALSGCYSRAMTEIVCCLPAIGRIELSHWPEQLDRRWRHGRIPLITSTRTQSSEI
jgi:hypothetical protein